jgi:hypothetical protein
VSAVGDLDTNLVRDGIALSHQEVFHAGEDVLFAADLLDVGRPCEADLPAAAAP